MADEPTRRDRIQGGRRDIQSFWSSAKGAWAGIAILAIAVVGFFVAVFR